MKAGRQQQWAHGWAVLGVLAVAAACSSSDEGPYIFPGAPGTSEPHVVVTLQDGTGQGGIWSIKSTARMGGTDSTKDLPAKKGTAPISFPATYSVVTRGVTGPLELTVEGLNEGGTVIARAKGQTTLEEGRGVTLELSLVKSCAATADCDDATYCNGAETCENGMCRPGAIPCPASPFACVQVACQEAEKTCRVGVDHAQCSPLAGGDGGASVARYCDPGAGCVAGEKCLMDVDCQDAFECNGAERCVSFHCLPGTPLATDDMNPCTTDACVEGQNVQHFSVPDGNACTTTTVPGGVCIGGLCMVGTCGDGFRDVRAGEGCDNGAAGNSDTLANACRTDCSVAHCGDHVRDLGEQCDDGNDVDTDACRNTCETARCGDAVVNANVEQCDDGNAADTDGCKRDCTNNTCGDGVVNAGVEVCDDGNLNPNDACHQCRPPVWVPQVVVGLGQHEGRKDRLLLAVPEDVVFDRSGNMYVADWGPGRLWRLDAASGQVTRAAGVGNSGYAGDGLQATSAALAGPYGLALDERGNLYIGDSENHRIRKVDRNGIMSTVAGTGEPGFSGDGQAATDAQLNGAQGVTLDAQGNLFIADTGNNVVRKVDTRGIITTVAGNGVAGFGGDGMAARNAQLNAPVDVQVDGDGTLYISDTQNHRIRVVTPQGTISTMAGTGTPGAVGDDGPATDAQMNGPQGMALDLTGVLYVAEPEHHRVRRISGIGGTITTAAGTGVSGYTGDDGLATAASLNFPRWVALDLEGNLYISEELNQTVRKVDSTGTITTFIGLTGAVYAGYGTASNQVWLQGPNGVAVGGDGSLFVPEYEGHRIRRIWPDSHVTTVVGTGEGGFSGDGMQAANAQILIPDDVAVDGAGNLIFSDSGNHRIRKVNMTTGVVTTVAGQGVAGFTGDGMDARTALLNYPSGLDLDAAGNIYFSDSLNHRIRKIGTNGAITTVAGSNLVDNAGDDGPALSAGISHVYGMDVDADGNIYFAEDTAHVVRRVDAITGMVTRVVGTGVSGSSGDGGLAVNAQISLPGAVHVDAAGNLFISESLGQRVRCVDAVTKKISTVAGSGVGGFTGDFGPAVEASLNRPYYLHLLPDGAFYMADYGNGLVRKVDAAGVITTVAGTVHPGDGPFATAALAAPFAMVEPTPGTLLVSDGRSGFVRRLDTATSLMETVAGYPRAPAPDPSMEVPAGLSRLLKDASGMAYDATTGVVYVAERGGHTIRRLTMVTPSDPSTWTISTFAGVLDEPGSKDGTLAQARFREPTALVLKSSTRQLLVVEAGNHGVRAIKLDTPNDPQAVTTLVNASRLRGYFGENIPATGAVLDSPEGLALGLDGSLYIADTGNHRVRRVDPMGIITTVIGDGSPAVSGTGTPARFFPVESPSGLAVDSFGNLFISSAYAVRVVSPEPPSTTVHGADGELALILYGAAPRRDFPQSVTRCLTGLHLGATESDVSMLDACQGFLVKLARQ